MAGSSFCLARVDSRLLQRDDPVARGILKFEKEREDFRGNHAASGRSFFRSEEIRDKLLETRGLNVQDPDIRGD